MSGLCFGAQAGELHSVALAHGGSVLTWGDNQRGQCGRHPELPLLPTPGRAVLPLRDGEAAVQVAAGGYRSAAISSSGRLLVLGLTEVDEVEPDDVSPYGDDDEAGDSEPAAWGGGRGGGATRRGGGGGRKRREPTVWESREVEREVE